jgi:preprotein translocase subunit SecD
MILNQKIKITIMLLVIIITAVVVTKLDINLGLDLQGGMRLILEAQNTKQRKANNDAVLGAMAVIQNRIDELGVREAQIRRKGLKQIIVELPGIKDPERAMKLIGDTALLEFVEAEWAPEGINQLSKEKISILAGDNARLDKVEEKDKYGKIISSRPIILKNTVLTGADLANASPGINRFSNPIVNIEFNSAATKTFRDITTKHVGKPLAIVLDGKIISAPNVSEPILGGKAIISGRFTPEEMRDLVIKLKAGALPVPIEIISNKTVGPTLGRDSIEKSKKAGLIAFVLVILFMLICYRLPGLSAGLALILYIFIVLACFKLCKATLTLPGIAGFILTLGMAVDANIIIFERIKEERKAGQALLGAIKSGFHSAFRTILDANITTLIAAIVLFWLGTGPIRGFAVTLSIGIIVSMFSAIFITRLLIDGLSSILNRDTNILFKG